MDRDQARRRLEQERERLDAMLHSPATRALESSQRQDSGELSSYDQHPADSGTDTIEREQAESIAEHAKAALQRVDEAMARLEEGTYGICAECGAEIPDERLEVRPEASLCTEHQRDVEQRV